MSSDGQQENRITRAQQKLYDVLGHGSKSEIRRADAVLTRAVENASEEDRAVADQYKIRRDR